LNRRGPSVFEANTADGREDVDAPWFDTDLQTDARLVQLRFGEAHEWRAELAQSRDHFGRVGGSGFYPDIEIHRRTWSSVDADGVRTDDHEPRVSGQ
jgi:hypothetical protein